jgi:hypothetical protein
MAGLIDDVGFRGHGRSRISADGRLLIQIDDPADISFDQLLDSPPNVDGCVALSIALCCIYQLPKGEWVHLGRT